MGKVSREELVFTQLIIRAGLLTLEQYQEALEIRSQIERQTGTHQPLDRVIVERRFLDEKVVDNICQKIFTGSSSTTSVSPKMPVATAVKNSAVESAMVGDVFDNPPAPAGFRLGEKLGEGAMGAVFKGFRLEDNLPVAIKFMDPRYNKNVEWVQRFLREAEAIKWLQHPNIVKALTSGEQNGVYYLVMEFIPGESVLKILETQGRLTPERALRITKQVALALHYAHNQGIVHRDIKPENILVGHDDAAKICDFGLVRCVESDTLTTRVGSFIGTPHYVSPEQAKGLLDIDCRTDIYSLGCSLYHMIVGQPPYPHDNPVVVLTSQATKPFPDPLEKVPDLPPKLSSLIRKMGAKDRAMRVPNAETLLQAINDLQQLLEDGTASAATLDEADQLPESLEGQTASPMVAPEKKTRRITRNTTQRITKRRSLDSSVSGYKRSKESTSSQASTKKNREIAAEEKPLPPPPNLKVTWAILIGIALTLGTIIFIVVQMWANLKEMWETL